jgi:hypothetical protein
VKRNDIDPGGVYSLVSYRDSRQGWPVMILSTDSYELDWRTKVLDHAGRARLVQGDYRHSAVGLLTVKLGFSMHSGRGDDGDEPPMDVLEFRAKVEKLRDLVDVSAAITALNASADKVWDDREHLYIRDAEGELLGTYELLTGLQMVPGSYVPMVLSERRAEAQRNAYASEHEQQRVARVADFRELRARLQALGLMDMEGTLYDSSDVHTVKLSFATMARLLTMAETGHEHEITTQDMMG